MIIRSAIENDLATIVAIYNASIKSRMATADLDAVSVESRRQWFYARSSDTPEGSSFANRPLWVMQINGTVVGWLSFQSFYGRPAYKATAEISIYIAPAYQYQGLGKKLLAEAIYHSPKLGLKTLTAFIFAHNEPSIQLFSRFGFQTWGHLPKVAELDGLERDLIIMGLRLT
jgi:L-amino acid N-acyltransferase YncA